MCSVLGTVATTFAIFQSEFCSRRICSFAILAVRNFAISKCTNCVLARSVSYKTSGVLIDGDKNTEESNISARSLIL